MRLILLGGALAFSVIAGFNDGGNVMAVAVTTGSVHPGVALVVSITGILAGPAIFGTAVATTIATRIVDMQSLPPWGMLSVLVAALMAVLVAWAESMPTSLTFALAGALVGVTWAEKGIAAVRWAGVATVWASLLLSVCLGFLMGFLLYRIGAALLIRVSPREGPWLRTAYYLALALVSLGYGANDAEKVLGLLGVVAALGTGASAFRVPFWALPAAAATYGAGVILGGQRIVRTVGHKVFRMRRTHALFVQAATGMVVLALAVAGGPVSTSQCLDSAIMGVGTGLSRRRVHWEVAIEMVAAVLVTVLMSFALGLTFGVLARTMG